MVWSKFIKCCSAIKGKCRRPSSKVDEAPTRTSEQTAIDLAACRRKLDLELATCLPLLKLMASHLRQIDQEVEQSVVQACSSFHEMAERARQAALTADGGFQHSGTDGASTISRTQSSLQSLLDHVRSASDFSLSAAQRLTKIENQFTQVHKCLNQVEQISETAELVALNGRIEAARAGTHGRSFAIVAEETKSLAKNAARTSAQIRDLVTEVSKDVTSTSEEIQKRVQNDATGMTVCEESIDQALKAIRLKDETLEQALRKSLELGESRAQDINRAIHNLQFQDAVSQRLHHIIGALEQVIEHFGRWAPPAHEVPADVENQWLDLLQKKYTMDSERKVHCALASATTTPSAPLELSSNVELF